MSEVTGEETTAEGRVADLLREAGVREELVPTYAAAHMALRDTENAARLRAAGYPEAAALLQPSAVLIDAAWGEDR
ncbi:hypothetical protein AB0I69_42525 [Streptomyces sp. NPDC050508]|uniref:hypothetical protein n=1 Tax=Streptomyces sp. NPDC050508 TaxID=3155405 RepID=UPI003414200B